LVVPLVSEHDHFDAVLDRSGDLSQGRIAKENSEDDWYRPKTKDSRRGHDF
jgi:hypothetical protein